MATEAGRVGKPAGSMKENDRTAETHRNSGAMPRPKGDLHQSPYPVMTPRGPGWSPTAGVGSEMLPPPEVRDLGPSGARFPWFPELFGRSFNGYSGVCCELLKGFPLFLGGTPTPSPPPPAMLAATTCGGSK